MCIVSEDRSYALRQEVDQIREEYAELLGSTNRTNIKKWERERSNKNHARCQFRCRLVEYLQDAEKARQREMTAIREQRRQLIYERLQPLGWAGEDVKIDDTYAKPWKALVDVPQPLSDKACTTLMPKLVVLLGKNRKYKELQTRRKKTQELFAEYERDVHGFESLLKLLGQEDPPLVANPFPDMAIILEWDNVKELYEPDMPIETVSTRFTENLSNFENRLVTWRNEAELQLINNLGLERKPDARTVLKIQESTASTKKLPPHTRFLLRADTIFKALPIEQNQTSQWHDPGSHASRPTIHSLYYYPDLLISPEGAQPRDVKPEDLVDLSRFTRHTEAEKIVRALLANLGMPDVAYMELKAIGAGFTCGRCYNRRSVTWENIVEHYREMNEKWEKEARYQREQQTRHKITFINSHDFTAGSNKPLVSLGGGLDGRTPLDELECKLCLVGWRSTTCDRKPGIVKHLENV
ncbi:hypothetical protein FRC10_011019 [Ceratobasidium sp. 414]|nr:hypothetical protein FRC10_011019 [Ceratobasidium sp. 414]